jgi:hypothetical protein
MATANELYTRGAPGDADNRGESLVRMLRRVCCDTAHDVINVPCTCFCRALVPERFSGSLFSWLAAAVAACVCMWGQHWDRTERWMHAGLLPCSLQVQQHLDRMQQQKEAAAMERLRTLMPQMGDVVRALALSKADWDLDQAVSMLRSFQVAHLDKVNNLNKARCLHDSSSAALQLHQPCVNGVGCRSTGTLLGNHDTTVPCLLPLHCAETQEDTRSYGELYRSGI